MLAAFAEAEATEADLSVLVRLEVAAFSPVFVLSEAAAETVEPLAPTDLPVSDFYLSATGCFAG